jgi:hypothetical protein
MDITASVFFVVVGAVLISVVWYAGVRKRAELQQQFAVQASETQRLLTDMSARLADLSQRTADLQRILKDAE